MPLPLKMIQKRRSVQLFLFVVCALGLIIIRRDDDQYGRDDDDDVYYDGFYGVPPEVFNFTAQEYKPRKLTFDNSRVKHAQKVISRNKTHTGLLRYFEEDDFKFHTTDPNGTHMFMGECIKSPSDPPITICTHPKEDDLMSGYIIDRPCRCWEPEVGDMVIEMLRHHPEAVYIDAGANLGTHAVMGAAAGHQVWAIEPLTTNLVKMYQSAVKTGVIDKMTLVQNGVDFNRTVSHIRAAMGGIAASQMKPNISGIKIDEVMGIAEEEYEAIHTILLTDIIDAINKKDYPRSGDKRLPIVLKIDVESYECRAFLGAPGLFDDAHAYVPYVIMEWAYLDNDPQGTVCPEEMLEKVTAFFTSHKYAPFQLEDIFNVLNREKKSMMWMDPAVSVDWANSNVMWVHEDALPLILTFFDAKAFDKLTELNDYAVDWRGPKLRTSTGKYLTDECVEQSPLGTPFKVCVHAEENDAGVSAAMRADTFKWKPVARVLKKVFDNYPDCLFLDAGSDNLGAFGLLAAASGHTTWIMETVKGNIAFIHHSVRQSTFSDKVRILRDGMDGKRARLFSHGEPQNLARSILESNISRSIGIWAQDTQRKHIQDVHRSEYDYVNMVLLSDVIKNMKAKEPMKNGSKHDIVLKVLVSNQHLRAILQSESIFDDTDIYIPYILMTEDGYGCDPTLLELVSKLLPSKGYTLFDMEGQSHFKNLRVQEHPAVDFVGSVHQSVVWIHKHATPIYSKASP